ncbi:MAG: hypothetical protein KGI54_15205 [Pseudomonadota bacterium]|nr:hypothetical protein [Pseudomonadota bacterium]
MQFSFDLKDLEDSQQYKVLEAILEIYGTAPVTTHNMCDKDAGPAQLFREPEIEAVAIQPETNSAQGTPAKRGRPKKEPNKQSAAELVKALNEADSSTLVEAESGSSTLVEAESGSSTLVEAESRSLTLVEAESEESFDLLTLSSAPTTIAPKPEVNDHQKLVDRVREYMFHRNDHVWMRNVLEKNKKQGKTLAEMPPETLQGILDNPDQYNALA